MSANPARRRRTDRLVAALIAVLAVLVAVVVYLTSDIRAAALATGPAATAPSTATSIQNRLSPVWSAPTDPALGAVTSPAGVVVTTTPHGVTAHDSTTGATRWSYTRSNRTLCRVAGLTTKPLKRATDDGPPADTDGIAAVYAENGFCSQVETFLATTGNRARTRTSPLAQGGSFVTTGGSGANFSGWVSGNLVEVWRDDLVRTLQYGDLPNPTQPGNPHLDCDFTDLLLNPTQLATVEHCAARGPHARVVLNVTDPGCKGGCGYPDNWDQFKHSPRADIDTGSDAAVLVGLTADRVAVLVASPTPALVVYDAAGQQSSRTRVDIPAAQIVAAANGAPLPAVARGDQRISLVGGHLIAVDSTTVQAPAPATTLSTPTSSTAPTSSFLAGLTGLPGLIGSAGSTAVSSGAPTVSLAGLTLSWTYGDVLGLPAVLADQVLVPVRAGLARFSAADGPTAGAAPPVIPLDRGATTGRVDAGAVGSTVVEWRGSTVVALR